MKRHYGLSEEDVFHFVGDWKRKTFAERQRAIWEKEPRNRVYFANYISSLLEDATPVRVQMQAKIERWRFGLIHLTIIRDKSEVGRAELFLNNAILHGEFEYRKSFARATP